MLRLTERRDGDVIHFLVENIEPADVTATFDLKLINLKANTSLPYTTTVGPHQTVEAFTLSRLDDTKQWHFNLTNDYTLGSNRAVHDDRYEYSLPYQRGKSHRVTQADDGAFSHSGPERHAIDWEMPEGTPVLAARDGVVVDTKDDSDSGGPDRSFQAAANYVLIQHPDGTIGNYAHLRKHGVKVSVGQSVRAGDLIGLSGNTGFSSGPHLHFSVFKTRSGHERESIPIHFRTESGSATLVGGRAYKAPSTLIAAKRFAAQSFTQRGEKRVPEAMNRPPAATVTSTFARRGTRHPADCLTSSVVPGKSVDAGRVLRGAIIRQPLRSFGG